MSFETVKKTVLYGLGVILLGILTNAIWEFFAKPLMISAQDAILNLSILGIQRLKDATYINIAKGHYDRASLELLTQFSGLSAGVLTAIIFYFFQLSKKLKKKRAELKRRVQGDEKQPMTREELLAEIDRGEPQLKSLDRLMYAVAFITILLVTINFLSTIKLRYVDAAINHFEQTLAIVCPYLEPGKEKSFRSTFAQIRTRKDYEQLILQLKAIATTHHQNTQDFDIW